jgi:hypothetical protein
MSTPLAYICRDCLSDVLQYPLVPESAEVANWPEVLNHTRDLTYYSRFADVLKQYENGWIVKDVNQPFMHLEYIKRNPGKWNVLYIERDLSKVIYRMFKLGWFWPVLALAPEDPSVIKKTDKMHSLLASIGETFRPQSYHYNVMLPDLVRAVLFIKKTCYDPLPVKIQQQDILKDINIIPNVLKNFGYSAKVFDYRDAEFEEKRKSVTEYNRDPLLRQIRILVKRIGNG